MPPELLRCMLKNAKRILIPDRDVKEGAPREGGAPKFFPVLSLSI